MAEKKEDEEEGVLLYYKYANVPDLDELVEFYNSNCNLLGLRGRVRIATHGVNVTVGGALASLEKHIAEVQLNKLFERTDFKLASCSFQSNDQIVKECGFTSLSVRVVKELVTFSSNPLLKSPVISNAGKHLSAVEFNTFLQSAGASLENCGSSQNNKILLLDARNVYETRIGRFRTPNVETLDPKIRQYSDLCTWIDSNSEQLQGTNVLMYCTGGIRCEMASAYIRSKGAGYENVFQLYGGIQRYLEQFPDGGFFKGKNFVFDHRISVGSTSADIVGSCLLCQSPFDDYSARCRCIYCRMLVLVCNDCQEKNCSTYVCELCQKQGQKEGAMPFQGSHTPDKVLSTDELQSVTLHNHTSSLPQLHCEPGTKSPKKLRILCLHGFRQNASSFKGRTSSLSKKIKHLAELVFVDAPHELPFIYIPSLAQSNLQNTPPPEKCRKKFAWLVSQEHITSTPKTWEMSEKPFDPLQYKQQTYGYGVSLNYLKEVFASKGPFDGVLGFSQGAAMAAMICAERGKGNGIDFRFVVLCSGFGLGRVEKGSIDCPSLHVFGDGEDKDSKDRQIGREDSMELVDWFKESCVEIITHGSGHIIPTKSPYIDRVKTFLLQFL